jgi:glycerol-3-phosphate dehydrogenase
MRSDCATAIAKLQSEFPGADFNASADERNIVTLTGECENYDTVLKIGKFAANQPGVKNVVNDLTVKGAEIKKFDYESPARIGRKLGVVKKTDIVIIGAGISGCAIARELSRYDIGILVVEKFEDVGAGATKANNGNIHAGNSVKPGTLKAKLNIEGNRLYTKWSEELGFELDRVGLMGIIDEEKYVPGLKPALAVANLNGVDGAEIIDGEKTKQLEPALIEMGIEPIAAIRFPSFGLVDPYEVAVALAENAVMNKAEFWFNATAAAIETENGRVKAVVTDKGIVETKIVINCAGVYSDEISALAGDKSFTIHPRKGVIAILDKNKKHIFNSVAEVINEKSIASKEGSGSESKGGGMCYTVEGNFLLGPSATEITDKEDLETTPEDLDYAMGRSKGDAGYGEIIRFFAGVRAPDYKEDFIIEASPVTEGFINCAAIQSPGLAAAPAIAKMVVDIVKEKIELLPDKDFNPIRKAPTKFRKLSRAEQDELIKKDPRYGKIVCRCETITEGEILDAIAGPVTPVSIDAIKRRARAGMGRCQGGFCQPRVLEILAQKLGREWIEINLREEGTNVLIKNNRTAEGNNEKN